MTSAGEPRPPVEMPATCSFCNQPIPPDEDSLLLMRNGSVVAAYHERCRPDRRRGGCTGC